MSMDTADDLEYAEDHIAELAARLALIPGAVDPWADYCRPTCGEADEPGACTAEQYEDGTLTCGCPCHERTQYDTASSASRQHWIDTGRYLTTATTEGA